MSVVDKSSYIPYYKQLAELLKREITQGKLAGQLYQLPSENELAERNGLSRATVRHALAELEQEGWIYRQKGVGSFAAVRRVEQDLTQLVSTTQDLHRRGWALETRILSLQVKPAAPHVSQALELPPKTPVYELIRLRNVEARPLSLQTAFLPVSLCPNLDENDLSGSLYRLLESRYGLRLWTGQETLRAQGANAQQAELLELTEGAPVMYAERVTYSATGVAVEYLEAVWRGDRYDFKVTLTRPSL